MQKDELDPHRPNSTSGPRCPQKSYGGRGHGGGGVCMVVGREERRGWEEGRGGDLSTLPTLLDSIKKLMLIFLSVC